MSLSKSTEYFLVFTPILYVFLILSFIMFGYHNMKHYIDCILGGSVDIFMCLSEDTQSLEEKSE